MRSLSNLIKSQYITLNQQGKAVGWGNGFQSLVSSIAEATVDEAGLKTSLGEEVFAGEDVTAMQRLLEEEAQVSEKAERLLLDAEAAAEKIIEDAKNEAEAMRQHAAEEGKRAGYLEGLEQGQQELRNREAQLEQERCELIDEYHQLAAELEPKFATVVARLLEKLTGVLVKEHEEVILHLIGQGMAEAGKSKNLVIQVSSEDYRRVTEAKETLMHGLPEDVEISIREEEEFTKNQCLIETDGKMIDCSLDVQLKSLITDVKLLSSLM